jgi:hypothetical protein
MTAIPPVTALAIGASLTFGMVLALLGHLKLALARRPENATGRIDLLLSLLNLALIPLMLAAGLLVDFWGIQPTLITGSVLLSLAFLALGARPAYGRAVVAVLVAGFGAAAVGTASLILMPWGLFGKLEATASLQFGLVLVAFGALLMPPLMDVLVRAVGFGRTMAVVAFLVLAPACLTALTDTEALPPVASLASLGPLLQNHGVYLAGLVFFCYAPLEAFVSVWTTTYLGSVGQAQHQVRWLTGFWVAFLLSRLAVALVEHAGYLHDNLSGWFLVGTAWMSAVVIGNLSGATRHNSAAWGLVLLGCFLGPLFPLLAGLLFRQGSAADLPGTAFGILYACGSLGSLALAPLVGLSARSLSIQTALRIPLFIAMLLSAAALLFALAA